MYTSDRNANFLILLIQFLVLFVLAKKSSASINHSESCSDIFGKVFAERNFSVIPKEFYGQFKTDNDGSAIFRFVRRSEEKILCNKLRISMEDDTTGMTFCCRSETKDIDDHICIMGTVSFDDVNATGYAFKAKTRFNSYDNIMAFYGDETQKLVLWSCFDGTVFDWILTSSNKPVAENLGDCSEEGLCMKRAIHTQNTEMKSEEISDEKKTEENISFKLGNVSEDDAVTVTDKGDGVNESSVVTTEEILSQVEQDSQVKHSGEINDETTRDDITTTIKQTELTSETDKASEATVHTYSTLSSLLAVTVDQNSDQKASETTTENIESTFKVLGDDQQEVKITENLSTTEKTSTDNIEAASEEPNPTTKEEIPMVSTTTVAGDSDGDNGGKLASEKIQSTEESVQPETEKPTTGTAQTTETEDKTTESQSLATTQVVLSPVTPSEPIQQSSSDLPAQMASQTSTQVPLDSTTQSTLQPLLETTSPQAIIPIVHGSELPVNYEAIQKSSANEKSSSEKDPLDSTKQSTSQPLLETTSPQATIPIVDGSESPVNSEAIQKSSANEKSSSEKDSGATPTLDKAEKPTSGKNNQNEHNEIIKVNVTSTGQSAKTTNEMLKGYQWNNGHSEDEQMQADEGIKETRVTEASLQGGENSSVILLSSKINWIITFGCLVWWNMFLI